MSRRKRPWQRTRSEWACRRKHRYESERVARARADEFTAATGKTISVYHCPECKKYHLTSQKREEHHGHTNE